MSSKDKVSAPEFMQKHSKEEWTQRYKIITGYYQDFGLVDKLTGLSIRTTFSHPEEARKHAILHLMTGLIDNMLEKP